MLTGDTLFVGDVARPDLAVEEEGARGHLPQSLHESCCAAGPESRSGPGTWAARCAAARGWT